jgi:hypothetical protein
VRDDALPLARLLLAAAAIVACVLVSVIVVATLMHVRRVPFGGEPVARPARPEGEAPSLQTAPQVDLARYRREQAAALARGATAASSGTPGAAR